MERGSMDVGFLRLLCFPIHLCSWDSSKILKKMTLEYLGVQMEGNNLLLPEVFLFIAQLAHLSTSHPVQVQRSSPQSLTWRTIFKSL